MKSILQSIAILAILKFLGGCTAYVDPGVSNPSTTTTTTVAESPYVPGATVTERTTTTR
jgi:hypothetical protein